MTTNNQSDITVKEYNSGKLSGKVALFFNTDKAKQVYKTMLIDSQYILAYANSPTLMDKIDSFCSNHKLHYEIVSIN